MQSLNRKDTLPEVGGMVLVMGVTGAGKSTFVNALKPESVTVGHNLESTQAPPQAVQIFLDEEKTRSITVVDTPGFDDTRRSNTQILAEITEYLATQYALQIPLRGIIYMHSINENRMKRSSRQFLEMFQLLCGDDALRKVKFVTTHWDNIDPDREGEALRREQQLLDEWWAPMLEKGSSNTQFSGSHDSAEGIVLDLMSDEESIVLEVQRELVDCDMDLGDTKAGKSLRKVIEDDIAQCKTSIEDIDTQMANATRPRRRSDDDGKMDRNQAEVKALRRRREDLQKRMDELEPRQRELKARGKVGQKVKRKISEEQKKANADKAKGMFSSAMEVFTAVLNIVLVVVSFAIL